MVGIINFAASPYTTLAFLVAAIFAAVIVANSIAGLLVVIINWFTKRAASR